MLMLMLYCYGNGVVLTVYFDYYSNLIHVHTAVILLFVKCLFFSSSFNCFVQYRALNSFYTHKNWLFKLHNKMAFDMAHNAAVMRDKDVFYVFTAFISLLKYFEIHKINEVIVCPLVISQMVAFEMSLICE